MTRKVIRGGAGSLISLRAGTFQLSAKLDGRLVLDRPHFIEGQQFRLVPDFRQKPTDLQYISHVRKRRRRLQLAAQAGIQARPETQPANRKITLSAFENGISGWYRLKISATKDVLRQIVCL